MGVLPACSAVSPVHPVRLTEARLVLEKSTLVSAVQPLSVTLERFEFGPMPKLFNSGHADMDSEVRELFWKALTVVNAAQLLTVIDVKLDQSKPMVVRSGRLLTVCAKGVVLTRSVRVRRAGQPLKSNGMENVEL